MKRAPYLMIVCASILLTSCTKKFYVEPTPSTTGTIIRFYDRDSIGKRDITPCIWFIDIIDDDSGQSALRLRANRQCVISSKVNISLPQNGLTLENTDKGLKVGRVYHAEVSAEGGVGRSHSWRQ